MNERSLDLLLFLDKTQKQQFNRAGYHTLEDLVKENPEVLCKKVFCSEGQQQHEDIVYVCKKIIEYSKIIIEREPTPKKTVSDITNKFFEKIKDDDWIDWMNLLSYLSVDLFRAYDSGYMDLNDSNVFLINTGDNIDFLTKRAMLLPTKPSISFQSKEIIQIDHYNGCDIETGEKGEYQFFCHLPETDFGTDWFWSVKPLLESGLLQYIPNIVIDKELYDGTRKVIDTCYTIRTKECTISGKEQHLNDIGIQSLDIEIPYIDDIPLSLFSEISANKSDALEQFRMFFIRNINNIDFSKMNEKLDFELTMKGELYKIGDAIIREGRKIKRKSVFNGIATAMVCGATLYIFKEQQDLVKCLLGISGGSGLLKFISDISDYYIQKVDIENNDCWFLWLLKK